MSGPHRTRNAKPSASGAPAPPGTPSSATPPVGPPAKGTPSPERNAGTRTSPTAHVPRTRVGAAWLGICATALVCVVLIVFMLQNTRSAEVTFLAWHGTLPLALALLIAAVGSAILTMAIGTARIAQLRRFSARQRARDSR